MSNVEKDWVQELVNIMRRLRSEDGCPWDVEQTHRSLKRYLIEETSEFFDAIDDGDNSHMAEELGDILLQIVFHCRIGEESGAFTLQDAARFCCEKMIRRHPHVFADRKVNDADGVVAQWVEIKKAEGRHKDHESILDGIPRHLPALGTAEKMQKRASRVGFDWPDIDGVINKIEEELAEVKEAADAGDPDQVREEIGDLLFSVVNLSRFLQQDPEETLRAANRKFYSRFREVEARVEASGKSMEETSLQQLERFWAETKGK